MSLNAKIDQIAAATGLISPPAGANGAALDNNQGSSSETDQGRYRLVIEEGPRNGAFVYKTLDRITGEVVRQFPREQVLELMQASDYRSGRVIDTNA